MSPRCFLTVTYARPPLETIPPRVRLPFDDIGNQWPEDRRELESVAAVACGNEEPRPRRVFIDPEVAVERVAIEAQASRSDRRTGQRSKMPPKELPEQIGFLSEHRPRCIRIDPTAGAVMSDLQRPIGKGGEAVPSGASDIGCPDGKARRLPGRRIVDAKMHDRRSEERRVGKEGRSQWGEE